MKKNVAVCTLQPSPSSLLSPDFELSVGDYNDYFDNGFVVCQRVLSPKGLQYIRAEADKVIDSLHETIDPEWIMNLHQLDWEHNWMLELARAPTIVAAASRCLEGSVPVLYCSQLSVRLPSSDRNCCTPVHQDGASGKVVTMWIALDRVDHTTGGLQVIPGGHKEGKFPFKRVEHEADLELATKMASHNVFEIEVSKELRKVPHFRYRLRAGGAGIHHPCLPHFSSPNFSNSPRRVIILRYMSLGETMQNSKLRHYKTGSFFRRTYYVLSKHVE
mmetsp:Transcript_4655/g.5369  ORF Transcript_4655/g.5369 Transcript_4655/m.5369 type:complete len:274 (+) Transcript_4655:54-875(+)